MAPEKKQEEPKNGNGKIWKTGIPALDGFLFIMQKGGLLVAVLLAILSVRFVYIELPDSQERREAMKKIVECQTQMVETTHIIQSCEKEQGIKSERHYTDCKEAHTEQNKRLQESYDVLMSMLSKLPDKGG